ncbi:MAG: homoserine kinase, partial [Micrococcales bacterium]|nr:homoserine kinase [Micrococcales bacterium]
MRLEADHVRVRVPATSANLGPGFDALGLALDLWDEIDARATPGETTVTVVGEGAGSVPLDETYPVVRAARTALEAVGAPDVGLTLRCSNKIPHGRGLGSSAAAAVAGALIVRGMIANPQAMNARMVLELATSFEGHPDNAAPAIFGRGTIAWMVGTVPRCARLDVHPEVRPVLAVPASPVSTRVARAVLPDRVPREDAVFNAGRAALTVHALTSEPSLLFEATEDRLHQSYRESVMAPSLELLARLRAERIPAVISGAGPTVLILTAFPPQSLTQVIGPDWTVMTPAVASH